MGYSGNLCSTILFLCCLASQGCVAFAPVVTQVLSADTVVLQDGTQVRYAGLEPPPKDSPWFPFCRDANAYLVSEKTVWIVPEPMLSQGTTVVAYVYTPIKVGKDWKYLFVNAEMARFGFAKVLPVPEDCQHKDLWQSLWDLQEGEAKPSRRGIWSPNQPWKGGR
jgi:endonuclease YncB( thermonuclease family)